MRNLKTKNKLISIVHSIIKMMIALSLLGVLCAAGIIGIKILVDHPLEGKILMAIPIIGPILLMVYCFRSKQRN